MRYLTIALSKGRLAELSIGYFEKLGIDCSEMRTDTRKLMFTDEKTKTRFFLAKPGDVPTYVDYGAADLGVVGKDTLLEEGRDFYEVIDLGFGACRMVLAGPKEMAGRRDLAIRRVATKYPRVAKEYFYHVRRESVEVIKLNGSVELAPLVGLSDAIVDLVESGKTLRENGLEVLDVIADISARLIVNRVSMKMENERIAPMLEGISRELRARGPTEERSAP